MDYRQKDYLVSQVRIGIFIEGNLRINPFNISDLIESHHVYEKAYDEALDLGLMTTSDIDDHMIINGLWGDSDDQKLKDCKDNIDMLKLRMYENRTNSKYIESLRTKVRIQENLEHQKLSEKNTFYSQSCESMADAARIHFLLTKSVTKRNKPVGPNFNTNILTRIYNKSVLSEGIVREIARSEPWKSLWSASKNSNINLFSIPSDHDITTNQKNLVLWSTTYDSIAESYEPPEQMVINDDDLLDGWFIYARKQREKEQAKKKLDEKMKNANIKDGNETFVMVNKEEGFSAEDIYALNDPQAQTTISRRFKELKNQETIQYANLPDIQDQAQQQARTSMKERSGGSRR